MPSRKDEIKYRVNRRGEVVQAEVTPLPETTPPNGPVPREAYRQNTVAAQAEVNLDRRRQALTNRLNARREQRAEERSTAIKQAAERAGQPDDRVTLEKLRLGDITVPEVLQRRLDQERSIGYALQFSWEAFQAISVSRLPAHKDEEGVEHPEQVILTDGQHRLYAAQLAYGDDVLVKCVVTQLQNIAQAAALFVTLNDERVGLNYNAKFKARLVAKDANAERLVALLQEFGLDYVRPGESRGRRGAITAMSTLESMVRQAGPSSARETLSVLKSCYGDDPEAYRDFMLAGVWQFLLRYDGLYRRPRLVQVLQDYGLATLAEQVPDFKSSINASNAAAACGAIHYLYNKHLPVKASLPPFAMEAKNRYGALIRKCAREWAIRHEPKNGQPARPIAGMYAPGNQVPRVFYRQAQSLPGTG